MKSSSASDVKSADTSEGWSFRGAAVAEGLKLPESRRCGRLELPESRFGKRENGPRADTADGIRLLKSRFCGCKISLGADSADEMMVPTAD